MSQRPQNGRNRAKSNITNRVHKRNRAVGPWIQPVPPPPVTPPKPRSPEQTPPKPAASIRPSVADKPEKTVQPTQPGTSAPPLPVTALERLAKDLFIFQVKKGSRTNSQTKIRQQSDKNRDIPLNAICFNQYLRSEKDDVTVYDPTFVPSHPTFHEYLGLWRVAYLSVTRIWRILHIASLVYYKQKRNEFSLIGLFKKYIVYETQSM